MLCYIMLCRVMLCYKFNSLIEFNIVNLMSLVSDQCFSIKYTVSRIVT